MDPKSLQTTPRTQSFSLPPSHALRRVQDLNPTKPWKLSGLQVSENGLNFSQGESTWTAPDLQGLAFGCGKPQLRWSNEQVSAQQFEIRGWDEHTLSCIWNLKPSMPDTHTHTFIYIYIYNIHAPMTKHGPA